MPMSFGGVSKAKVATIIVAADGTGDTTDIQTGINILPASGGVVYIKEGIYTIIAAIVIDSSNVSLRGAGYATEIKTASNIIMIDLQGAVGLGQITIDGIKLSGAGAGNDDNIGIKIRRMDNVSIYNTFIEETGGNGIDIDTLATDNRIWKTKIMESQNDGIRLGSSRATVLDSVLIVASERYGVFCDDTTLQTVLKSCSLYYNKDNQIHINSVSECSIIGGFIIEGEKHGIYIGSSGKIIVSNNIIKNNDYSNTASYDGIFMESSDYCIITGNVFEGNDRYNLNVSDAGSDGNILLGNQLNAAGCVGNINDLGTGTVNEHNVVI